MRSLLVLGALAACSRVPPIPTIKPPPPPKPRAPITLDPVALDRWLASEITERGIVGAAVVIIRDGETVFAKGYGTKRTGTIDPITPDTPFGIGSVTKQLTCAAVGLLADEGKLSFDDKIANWYPQLTRADDITLDDLGSHLAGYRDYYPMDYKDTRLVTAITPDALLEQFATMPLDFEPRSRGSYSNTGYVALARVVERVSGIAFDKFLAERIFQPLGMTHTQAGAPGGAATGHFAFLLGPIEPTEPEARGWELGAFGVWASATDLARWDLAFSDGRILSDASRARIAGSREFADGRTGLYGCGMSTRFVNGERVLGHAGAVEGFLAWNAFIPRTRSAVILLLNDARIDASDLHGKLVALTAERASDAPPAIAGANAEDAALSLILQIQRGKLDRTLLGDDLNAYFDDVHIAEASKRLAALGTPTLHLTARRERGAMEVTEFDIEFPTKKLTAIMFRAPNGKIHQLNLLP